MRRAADEIDRPVAQCRVGLVDREDEFKLDIEPFGLEEAEFDRGLGRKIRIGDHVRHGELHGLYFFPSSSQPNFSLALRATSGLGVLVGGNLSRQWNGRQASITATECVMSPAARFHGGSTGSAGESQEPLMNWIDCAGSVRVNSAHNRWSRLVTSTSSSTTTIYFE